MQTHSQIGPSQKTRKQILRLQYKPSRKGNSTWYKFCSQNPIISLMLIMGFAAVNLIIFSLYLSRQDEEKQSHIYPLSLHRKRVDFLIEQPTNQSQVTTATQIGLNLATLLNITKVLLKNPIDKMYTQFKESISEYNTLCVSKTQEWGNLSLRGDIHKEVVKEICQNLREIFAKFIDVERNLQYLSQGSFYRYNSKLSPDMIDKIKRDVPELQNFLRFTHTDTTYLCVISGIVLNRVLAKDFINFFLKTGEAIFTNPNNISEQSVFEIPLDPLTLSTPINALTDFLHTIAKKGADLFAPLVYLESEIVKLNALGLEDYAKAKYYPRISSSLVAYAFHLKGPIIQLQRPKNSEGKWLLVNEENAEKPLGDLSKFLKSLASAIRANPDTLEYIFAGTNTHVFEVLLRKLPFKGFSQVYDGSTLKVIDGLESLEDGRITLWNRNHYSGTLNTIMNSENPNLPSFIPVANNNAECSLYCVEKQANESSYIEIRFHSKQILELAKKFGKLASVLEEYPALKKALIKE